MSNKVLEDGSYRVRKVCLQGPVLASPQEQLCAKQYTLQP